MPVLAISTETSQQECQYRKTFCMFEGGGEEAGGAYQPCESVSYPDLFSDNNKVVNTVNDLILTVLPFSPAGPVAPTGPSGPCQQQSRKKNGEREQQQCTHLNSNNTLMPPTIQALFITQGDKFIQFIKCNMNEM